MLFFAGGEVSGYPRKRFPVLNVHQHATGRSQAAFQKHFQQGGRAYPRKFILSFGTSAMPAAQEPARRSKRLPRILYCGSTAIAHTLAFCTCETKRIWTTPFSGSISSNTLSTARSKAPASFKISNRSRIFFPLI